MSSLLSLLLAFPALQPTLIRNSSSDHLLAMELQRASVSTWPKLRFWFSGPAGRGVSSAQPSTSRRIRQSAQWLGPLRQISATCTPVRCSACRSAAPWWP